MALMVQRWSLLILILASAGCTSVQHVSKSDIRYETISASNAPETDESITALIAPYKQELDVQMNVVIGNVRHEMTKKKPESTLGNWVCDAMLAGAKKEGYPVDFAVANYGGLRIPYLTAGPLTTGAIFELSPFDNMLVILEMPGVILDSLLQQIASSEGWPVSKGLRMVIDDHQMVSCEINEEPFDPARTYHVAMPDYIANGGDGLSVLIPLSRVQTGKLLRDALIEHAKETTQQGQDITASIEGRIVNK